MSDDDLWQAIKRFTPARLGLGRSGAALPTKALLEIGVAHAKARVAVHTAVDWDRLKLNIATLTPLSPVQVGSAAADRVTYLRRPDLGRRLDEASQALLQSRVPVKTVDLVLVLADGLSAAALNHHGAAMLEAILKSRSGARLGAVVLAHNARVALGDAIGAAFNARFVVVAIGERPGLSSPDSLGLYLTYLPKPGRHDAERNCLSNIHGAGLSYEIAARKLDGLIEGALRLQASGTRLKDETDAMGFLLGDSRPLSGHQLE